MKTPPCQRARVLPEQKDYVADRTRSVTRPSRSWNLQWLQVSQQRIDIKVCNRCASLLGYHLKTGHTLSVQDRPTGLA